MNGNARCVLLTSVLLMAFTAVTPAQSAQPSHAGGDAAGTGNNGGQSGSVSGRSHTDEYVIGDDDMLEIVVWKEPELSKTVPVRSDGKISLPLVGELQAAGQTPTQLKTEITERLRNYITDPEVTVIVSKINSENFNVMGQVSKPGSYPLSVTTTVMDAIATAGGFRDFAKKKDVTILRENSNGTESRFRFNYESFLKGKNPQQNIRLQPGDTVVVR